MSSNFFYCNHAIKYLRKKFTVLRDAEDGQNDAEGWGNSAYIVSKVGVTALTMIQQRTFDAETPNRNVSVNAVHPGEKKNIASLVFNSFVVVRLCGY